MATDTIVRPTTLKLIRPAPMTRSTGALVFGFWFYHEVQLALPLVFKGDLAKVTLFSALISAFLMAVLSMAAYYHQRSLLPWPRNAVVFWAGVFLAWSGASIFWTFADSRGAALGYWGELAILVISVLLMLRFGDREKIALRSFEGIFWGMLLLVALLLVTGTFSGGRLGDVEVLHPNTIGRESAIALLCGFYLFRRSRSNVGRYAIGAGAAVLFAALIASVSKTSIGAFFIVMVLLALLAKKPGTRVKIIGALVMAALLAFPFTATKLEEYSRSHRGEAVETVSGRTPLWTQTWEMIQDRPLVGYGYLSFRDYGPQVFDVRVVHAHNEFLQVWFTLGLVGLGIAFALYWNYFRIAWRARRRPHSLLQANLAVAFGALALVRGITEADSVSLVFQLPLMLLLACWVHTSMHSVPAEALRRHAGRWINTLDSQSPSHPLSQSPSNDPHNRQS